MILLTVKVVPKISDPWTPKVRIEGVLDSSVLGDSGFIISWDGSDLEINCSSGEVAECLGVDREVIC